MWTLIKRFEILGYLYSNNIFKTREKYDRASKINLTYFMDETKPTYWVDDCFFGSFECSRLKLIIYEIINLGISWNKVIELGFKLSISVYKIQTERGMDFRLFYHPESENATEIS